MVETLTAPARRDGRDAAETRGVAKTGTRGAALQSATVLGVRVAGAVLQMLLVVTIALRFSVTDVGLNGLLWSVALVARMAGCLGVDVMGLRSQSPLWADGRVAEAVAHARRDFRALCIVWGGLLSAVAIGGVVMMLVGGPGGWVLALGVVAVASASQHLFVAQRQARGWPVLGQSMESVVLPGLGLLGAFLASLYMPSWLVPSQVAAFVVVAVVLGLLSPSGPLRSSPGRHRARTPRPRGPRVPAESGNRPGGRRRVGSGRAAANAARARSGTGPVPWRSALTVGAGNALTALCVRGPMFVMGGTSLAAAGIYEVAQKIQTGGAMGTSAVATVFASRIAVALKQPAVLIRLLVQAAVSSLVIPLGLLGFLFVVQPHGLESLLGPEYRGAWQAAVILVAATVLNATTSAMSNVLMLGGHERMFTVISGAQMLLVVGGAVLSGADTAVLMSGWVLAGEALRSLCMALGFWLHLSRVKTD